MATEMVPEFVSSAAPYTVPPAAHLRLLETEPELPELLRGRDPAFIRQAMPALSALVDRYYRAEVQGTEHLTERASLIVSTHNGGMWTPELYVLLMAFWRRFGLDARGYGMTFSQVFRMPLFGDFLTRLGALPASRENARTVLESDVPVLVCPGGDLDALKPWSQRHRVVFGGRRGFIRMALEQQVPIIPVVSVGAHETLMVLNDGRRLAKWTGAAKHLRIKSVPFALSFPFGLTIAGMPSLPLPSKITARVLPKIELAEPPTAAHDDAVVERCFREVRTKMQAALDDLAARRRWPVIG